MFSKYYQDELSYLRDLGREFAGAHPGIAPLLAEGSGDPDVERLLEGFAFLTSRIRQKVDDEIPEVIHAVANLLFPQFLKQVPSATIVEFSPLPNVLRERIVVAKGTELGTVPIDGTSCTFRTTQDVELMPMAVRQVALESSTSGTQDLVITLAADSGATWQALVPQRLRFYVATERRTQDELRMRLTSHVREVEVFTPSGGREVALARAPRTAVRVVGFAPSEALLPYPTTVFPGYRLLQEYFALPQKFSFFDVDVSMVPWERAGETVILRIRLEMPLPSSITLKQDSLRLFATPAINLFSHPLDPIRPEPTKHEYLLKAAGSRTAFELYNIDAVAGIPRRTNQRVTIPNFYSFAHELAPDVLARGTYYHTRLVPSVVGDGVDHYLSLGISQDAGMLPDFDVISMDATCTNRRLTAALKLGDVRVPTMGSPAVATFKNIAGVSPPVPPPIGKHLPWRVLSHMAITYRTVADAHTLRSLVDLYNLPGLIDRQAERTGQLIAGAIQKVSVRPQDRPMRGVPIRGAAITIELDEGGFSGEGDLFLFGSILSELFGSYVSINSFSQLTVLNTKHNTRYEWPAKNGSTLIL